MTWKLVKDEDRPALPSGYKNQWVIQVDKAVSALRALRKVSNTAITQHITDRTMRSMIPEVIAISKAIHDAYPKNWQSGDYREASFNAPVDGHQVLNTLNHAVKRQIEVMEERLVKLRQKRHTGELTTSTALIGGTPTGEMPQLETKGSMGANSAAVDSGVLYGYG
ncbi:hypothetical protein EMMF5_001431, partial [Cystobasidiomycetes sp. EMM_F5]